MTERYDIAVIGAGMAGASIAAELAPHARILLAEAEAQPGYHTTGRSAAFWEVCYGGPDVTPLTLASGPALRDLGVLRPRGALYIARNGDERALADFRRRFEDSGVALAPVGRAELERRIPGLRPGWTDAIEEPACSDIDVAALHHHYLSLARTGGVVLRTGARLEGAERHALGWRLRFTGGLEVRAGILVNAAGAWADHVAALAGVRPLGIAPLRRTVVQLRTNPPPPADLPLVLDLAGRFYFKPENGRVWLSPQDETPSAPCDAAPDELDIALAVDRLEQVVEWQVDSVERKWAGLRSFAPDRLPVYGHDARTDRFFWFAGQGGFGIQTAPAAARLAAQLMLGKRRDSMTTALDPALYSPARFG